MKLNFDIKTSQADPYVICHNDLYYMYATGEDGVKLFISKDFLNWEYKGICYQKEGQKSYWAPCVICIDNKFYMYVSSMDKSSNDVHTQRICVATSEVPEGPFKFTNELLEPFSIDPHVVKSGDELYIFYSINDYEAERAGTLIVVDKLISPYQVEGKPHIVVRPTLDEEIFMENRFKVGQHWHTLEGAFYFRKGDYHYVMYSGNCYEKETYYLGYATCKSSSNDLRELDFKKYPNENIYCPLISKNEFEEGTGHNSVLDIADKTYVIYHGRDLDVDLSKPIDHRTARIAEISIDNDVLTVIRR